MKRTKLFLGIFSLAILVSFVKVQAANPNQAAVIADKAALVAEMIQGSNPDLDHITSALTNPLPSIGAEGSTITWTSGNTGVVSHDGQIINRPIYADGDSIVVMTATITMPGYSEIKDFTLTVLRLPPSDNVNITSGTYTINLDGEIWGIGGVAAGTNKTDFLAALTKEDINQTWDDTAIMDPVMSDNVLLVTAEDGLTTRSYSVYPIPPATPANLQVMPSVISNDTRPTLIWDAVPDPTVLSYEITVVFGEINISSSVSAPNFTFESDLNPGNYTWQVRACAAPDNCGSFATGPAFTIDLEAPTVNTLGDGVNIYELPYLREGLYGVTLAFNEKLSTEGRLAVESALSAGADKPLNFIWNDNNDGDGTKMRMSVNDTTTAVFANDVYALSVTDLAGNVAENMLLINSSDPIRAIFQAIGSTLSNDFSVVGNIDTVDGSNYQSFAGLYFEKRTDVNDATTALGRITFNSTLDLSDPETQLFLQNIGDRLEVNTVGTVGLNLAETAPTVALKETSATIKFYGLDSLGFTAESTAEEIGVKMVAYDDNGAPLVVDDLAPEMGTYLGACEVGGGCYVYTIDVNHFTTYRIDTTAPTVTKWGDNSSDVIVEASATKDLVFSEALGSASREAVEKALTAGADHALTYAWDITKQTLTVFGDTSEVTTFLNDVEVTVSDLADNKSTSLLIVDSALATNQIAPVTGESGSATATMTNDKPTVIISDPEEPVAVTVDSGTTNPQIDVGSLISGGTGVLPQISMTVAGLSNLTVSIPATTTVTSADVTWNGIINAPTVTSVTLPETSGYTNSLGTAIELGYSGVKLSFDRALRLLLPGQAGKRIGYVRTGTSFTEITGVCSADTQLVGDALAADGECKIDVGSDLVVWTKHLTSFATFTQSANPVVPPSSGGGGGGGGGIPMIYGRVNILNQNLIATTTTATTTPAIIVKSSDKVTIVPKKIYKVDARIIPALEQAKLKVKQLAKLESAAKSKALAVAEEGSAPKVDSSTTSKKIKIAPQVASVAEADISFGKITSEIRSLLSRVKDWLK